MCRVCVDAMNEIFPEVPESERFDFLVETTCFPFGDGDIERKQLVRLRERMTSADYHECYAIADADTEAAVAAAKAAGTWPAEE